MRLSVASALALTLTASFVLGQDEPWIWNMTTGPFLLKITGKTDTSIDGYAMACHTMAAATGLCYVELPLETDWDYTNLYYFNYTGTDQSSGILFWNHPEWDENRKANLSAPPNHSQTARFLPVSPFTNVKPVELVASPTRYVMDGFGFDEADALYWGGRVHDDAKFKPDERPPYNPVPLRRSSWQLCFNQFFTYYFHSVSWITTSTAGVPNNPTCQAIDITREFVLVE